MPKRVRLTERRNRQAVDGSIPYPGNVNQPDRQFKKHNQYDNWEEVINHPLPDMRHDWQNDERDEIGFGIPEPWGESPTVASVKVAANKAVKLAYLLLGNKVAESIIEDQADDFMLLGPEAMDRTLARFAKTSELYAEDEEEDESKTASEEEAEETAEEKTASEEETSETEPVTAEDKGKEEEEKAAESIQEKKEEEAKEASEALAEEGAEDEGPVEDTGADEKEASDKSEEGESKEAAEKKAEDDDDDDDDDDDEDEGDSKEASETVSDMDIELTSTMDDGNVEDDSRLAGIFDDDIPEELPEPGAGKREASSKKQGIKSLGGQPKVAGDGGETQDISSIWADAPDVSQIFQ
jgi:hypothetical protein